MTSLQVIKIGKLTVWDWWRDSDDDRRLLAVWSAAVGVILSSNWGWARAEPPRTGREEEKMGQSNCFIHCPKHDGDLISVV